MSNWRLTKEDCDDIGFVYSCLISGAISFEEFKDWLYLVIEQEDEVPNYVWDAVDLEQKFDFLPLKVMGFTPGWRRTDDEDYAVNGISYRRREDYTSDAVPRDDALKKLRENPHIEDRFRKTFPFIDLA